MRIVVTVGARPNFIKAAPLLREFEKQKNSGNKLEVCFVHTGQHYDFAMSEQIFSELSLKKPDVNCEVGSGLHGAQTALGLTRVEQILLEFKPDWLVVFGDVNSTLAAALAACKLGIRVAHVEAGLRSFDRTMPEEINRVLTDSISDLLFTPSDDADENLKKEGIPDSKIKRVGNIMIDSLLFAASEVEKRDLGALLGGVNRDFVYATIHRPENVDDPQKLLVVLKRLEQISFALPVLLTLHPRTAVVINQLGFKPSVSSKLKMLPALGYLDSLKLISSARCVITDSGGVQEETTYYQTPCLTLRKNTERPITITQGSNKLTDVLRLEEDVAEILKGLTQRGSIPDLWDGHTAIRIADILLNLD